MSVTTVVRDGRRVVVLQAALTSLMLAVMSCMSGSGHAAARTEAMPVQSPTAADPARGCQQPVSQRTSNAGCWLTVETPLSSLPNEPAYWHLYAYPTTTAAEAARGPRGTVVESFGRHWLYTIEAQRWVPIGGERVAVIGPLVIATDKPHTARYMEAVFPPDYQTPPTGHRHSGPEAWFVLTGAQCLETPAGPMVVRAGEGSLVAQGPPMSISVVGPETRRAILLVLHPTGEPWVVPAADWTPKRICPTRLE